MRYAVIKNNIIEEILESDREINIELLKVGFSDYDFIIEETEKTGTAYKYSYFKDGLFSAPRPLDSWIFNYESFSWNPPKPIPDGAGPFIWNEDKLDWE